MACPHVAGAAALLVGENPGLSVNEVTQFVTSLSSRDKVSDTRGTTNRLLFVGSFPGASGGSPTPAPPDPDEPNKIVFVDEISEGSCADIKFRGKTGLPINDERLCSLAAQVLGVPDVQPKKTNSLNRPEGCYVFQGNKLFMGLNPNNKGKGAGTSTGFISRHPICGFPK